MLFCRPFSSPVLYLRFLLPQDPMPGCIIICALFYIVWPWDLLFPFGPIFLHIFFLEKTAGIIWESPSHLIVSVVLLVVLLSRSCWTVLFLSQITSVGDLSLWAFPWVWGFSSIYSIMWVTKQTKHRIKQLLYFGRIQKILFKRMRISDVIY